MGYITYARGVIRIEPPVPWGQIKDSPFLPNDRGGDRGLDIHLVIETSERETDEGVLNVVVATGIEERHDEPRNYYIVDQLQQLVDAFPDHSFVGRFDCEGEEAGDLWRLKVVNGKATRFEPTITWPADSE